MNEDAANLGCLAPDEAPKATEYIDQMQNMIGNLVNKGAAYPASNGDVYFEVTKFEKYGRLSGRKLDDMQAGASERVDVEVEKKHPFDFVLWKHAKEMNHLGHPLGVMAVRVGTLNVLQCRLAGQSL